VAIGDDEPVRAVVHPVSITSNAAAKKAVKMAALVGTGIMYFIIGLLLVCGQA
jgi:hypothetical protein